ncbi:MAG: Ca2+-binding RTX toxin-like protein [Candidatus Azotimanducaceae bacterium]|jgi:Ca2+-binding RTX toxin-like protein
MINDVYEDALLSSVSYFDFDAGLDYESSTNVIIGSPKFENFFTGTGSNNMGYSDGQFQGFVNDYLILHHDHSNLFGFSATVFQNVESQKITVSFRGTDGDFGDWFTNYYLTLGINSIFDFLGFGQGEAIEEFLKAAGLVDSTGLAQVAPNSVDFVGHSLGGYLAIMAAHKFPGLVDDVSTFNGAGIKFLDADWSDIAGSIDGASVSNNTSINTYYADKGIELTANDYWFNQPGDREKIFIEEGFGRENHSISKIVESLSVYRVLNSLAPTINFDAIYSILDAASQTPEDSLEITISQLGDSLGGNFATQVVKDDIELFYQDAIAFIENRGNTLTIDDLGSLSVDNIAAEAAVGDSDQSTGYRYALVNLHNFAITSNLDGTTADDAKYDVEHFEAQYLQDRALFLTSVLQRNSDDADYPNKINGEAIRFYDSVVGEIFAGGDNRGLQGTNSQKAENVRNIIFGDDGNNTIDIKGEGRNDNIYGMAGDDVLYGYLGDDTLSGGSGADTYEFYSGDGKDTIIDASHTGDKITINTVLLSSYTFTSDSSVPGSFGSYVGQNSNATAPVVTLFFNGSSLWIDVTSGDSRNEIVIDNFVDGDFGVALGEEAGVPEQPVAPSGFYPVSRVDDGNRGLSPGLYADAQYALREFLSAQEAINDVAIILDASSVTWNNTTSYGETDEPSLIGANGIYFDGGDADDQLVGGNRTDEYDGWAGNDYISLEGGDDIAYGGQGSDTMLGGDGRDILYGFYNPYYLETDGSVKKIVDLTQAQALVHNYFFELTTDSDILMGRAGDDLLVAGSYDDELDGGDGSDLLFGAAGSDILRGGDGNDIIHGDSSREFNNSLSQARVLFIDSTTVGFTYRDIIDGGAGDDFLVGEAGNDTIYGGSGNNEIYGDRNNDPLLSRYAGLDPQTDYVALTPSAHGNDHLFGGDQQDLIFGNGGDDNIEGGGGDDFLFGDDDFLQDVNHGNDKLYGGDGNDVIYAGAGDDLAYGGDDNDIIYGDNNSDDLATELVGKDILDGGLGDDWIYGNGGADELMGRDGVDNLYGGSGDDRLQGGIGSDYLEGGDDNDLYIVSIGDGRDTIVDSNGINTLFLSGLSVENLRIQYQSSLVTVNYRPVGSSVWEGVAMTKADFDKMQLAVGDESNVITLDEVDQLFLSSLGMVLDYIPGSYHGDSEFLEGGEIQIGDYVFNDPADFPGFELTEDFDLTGIRIPGGWPGDFVGGSGQLIGTDWNDVIIGNNSDGDLHGGFGDDILDGGPGDDLLDGGHGRDQYHFSSGDGDDTVLDFSDDDFIFDVTVAADSIYLEYSDDTADSWTVHYGSSGDTITGSTINWTDNINYVVSKFYQDEIEIPIVVRSSLTDGYLFDYRGDNVFIGGAGDDTFYLAGGADFFTLARSHPQAIWGDDQLHFSVGDGQDIVEVLGNTSGRRGQIVFDGTVDPETVTFAFDASNAWIYYGEQSDSIQIKQSTGVTKNALDNVEVVFEYVDAARELSIRGIDGQAYLYGSNGNDIIEGSDSAEFINPGSGNDIILAGGGNDTISLLGRDTLLTGSNAVIGGAGDDTIIADVYTGQQFLYNIGDGFDVISYDTEASITEYYQRFVFSKEPSEDDDDVFDLAWPISFSPPGEDAIIFGPGITLDSLIVTRVNDSLEINFSNVSGGITLPNFFFAYGKGVIEDREEGWVYHEFPGLALEDVYSLTLLPDFPVSYLRFDDGSEFDVIASLPSLLGINSSPEATDDSIIVHTNIIKVINFQDLLANDNDLDNDLLTITDVWFLEHGFVEIDLFEETITFMPEADYVGPASFAYTISDGSGTSVATVSVEVTEFNALPVAVDDTVNVAIDQPRDFGFADFLVNDYDGDGDNLTIASVSNAVNGIVSINTADKVITFAPTVGYIGPASFEYSISDGIDTSTASVVVDVIENDVPEAVIDEVAVIKDEPLEISFADLLENDIDEAGDNLSVVAVSSPLNGTVSINIVAQSITFTPTANYSGPASFEYTVSDGFAFSMATVTVDITVVNDPPVAVDDSVTTSEDQPLIVSFDELLSNDSDADGDTLTVDSVSDATNGFVTIDIVEESITFTPDANYNGPAIFDYTVNDTNVSSTATVTVDVVAVNDVPESIADTFAITEDQAVVISFAELLLNDSDVDGDSLTVSSVSAAINGAVVIDAVGETVIFAPDANYNGPVSFDYTVSDGSETSTSTVTADVTAVNDTPITFSDSVNVVEDQPLVIGFSELLLNDTDVDGDILTVEAVLNSVNGSVSIDAIAETITFTSTADFNGSAGFEYVVSDGTDTSTAIVTVDVTAVNDPPEPVSDSLTALENEDLVISFSDLLSNDIDVDDSNLTIVSVSSSDNGTISIDWVTETITFIPNTNYTGVSQFYYAVSDGVSTSVATVDINVGAASALAGTSSPDTITGYSSDDRIEGLGGDDVLNGVGGNDVLVGGDGDDTLNGGAGDDIFQYEGTDNGYDTIIGGDGFDTIMGSDGDDNIGLTSFDSSNGVEKIDGGAGTNGIVSDQYAVVWNFNDIEVNNISFYQGGNGHDVITGNDGNEVFIGGVGQDMLSGGAGDDIFQYEGTISGYDTIIGGDGFDTIMGSDGDDNIGLMSLDSANSIEKIDGGTGTNSIVSSNAIAVVWDFNDIEVNNISSYRGSIQGDVIIGNSGNEVFVGRRGSDTLNGGSGDDIFQYEGTNNGYDTVVGGEGFDTIIGSDGDDNIGLTSFDSSNGVEKIDGGAGINKIVGNWESQIWDFTNVELVNISVIDSGKDDDVITGNAANNVIIGGEGEDIIDGAEGDDIFQYEGTNNGYDTIIGGDGFDTIMGSDGDDNIGLTSFDVSNGVEEIDGGAGINGIVSDRYAVVWNFNGIEVNNISFYQGGNGNDIIIGNSGNEVFIGGVGQDTLNGGGGNDIFQYAGTNNGNDTIIGGDGFDTILGSSGDDNIVLMSIDSSNSIERIDGGTGTNSIVSRDETAVVWDFDSIEVNNISSYRGSNQGDVIIGNSGNEVFVGRRGSDILNGGSGDDIFQYEGTNNGYDTVVGGEGFDTIIGSDGDDYIGLTSFDSFNGVEKIDGGAGINKIVGNWESQIWDFTNVELVNISVIDSGKDDDVITGNAANNVIIGGEGADTIDGAEGDDILVGGLGNDTVIGGSGDDIYSYFVGDGIDTINNFSNMWISDFDKLVIEGVTYDQLWLSHVDDDLVIDIIGNSNRITIEDWFFSESNELDLIQVNDQMLYASKVDELVEAMESFYIGEPSSIDDFSEQQQLDLNIAISDAWIV